MSYATYPMTRSSLDVEELPDETMFYHRPTRTVWQKHSKPDKEGQRLLPVLRTPGSETRISDLNQPMEVIWIPPWAYPTDMNLPIPPKPPRN